MSTLLRRSLRKTRAENVEKMEPQMAEESGAVDSGPTTIPPWNTLPYHILFDIFLRASFPLFDCQRGVLLPSTTWLHGVALLCRAFAEPALAVLYHKLEITDNDRVQQMIDFFSQPPESLTINYANKVRELRVNPGMAFPNNPGANLYCDLGMLVEKVPNIKTIRVHFHDDVSLFLISPCFIYKDSFLHTLKRCNVRLHAFDWDARYCGMISIFAVKMQR